MSISYQDSILPMSELRMNLQKIKRQLKKTPIIITNKGKPDFGVCDLETLAIASQIVDLRNLLHSRWKDRKNSKVAEQVFKDFDQKYRAP